MTESYSILKAAVVVVVMMVEQGMCTSMEKKATEADGREKRSDDSNPLQAVVAQLTQQVTQLQAQVQANRNDIDAAVGQAVGFTVRTKAEDVHGLGLHQVIRFDAVVFNAGNGYDADTGIFTAPLSGTYVFFLQTLHHNNDDLKVFLDILKNGAFLSRAHAGFTTFENGSTLAVTHLNQGDTIRVEVSYGSQFWGGVYSTFAGFRVSSH